MDIPNIALVSRSGLISQDALSIASGAITKQVNSDLRRFWHMTAGITAFKKESSIPPSYWKVIVAPAEQVTDDTGYQVPGVHKRTGIHLDNNQNPYALVSDDGPDWTVRLSHEVLEMIVDPLFDTRRPGRLADGNTKVEYLIEICDPCQFDTYEIDGIHVSNFVTPAYYDETTVPGTPLCAQGNPVGAPLSVADGGSIVFRDLATGDYFAYLVRKGQPETLNLGREPPGLSSGRDWIEHAVRKAAGRMPKTKRKQIRQSREAHAKLCLKHALQWQRSNF